MDGKVFVKVHIVRITECALLQDAHDASNGKSIDFTNYKSTDHDIKVCHTNDAVYAINTK